MYHQKYHFAKEVGDGHEIPGFQVPTLMGDDCGAWLSGSAASADPCVKSLRKRTITTLLCIQRQPMMERIPTAPKVAPTRYKAIACTVRMV
jgi:hypothetical protein